MSCDRPGLLTVHPSTGQAVISTNALHIVTEPKLLTSTVSQCWRQWARTPGVLHALLQALQALLRDDHCYREFNAMQLNRVGLLDALLLFCKVGKYKRDYNVVIHTIWIVVDFCIYQESIM